MARLDLGDQPPVGALPPGLIIRPLAPERLAQPAQPGNQEELRRIYEAYKDAWGGLWGETPATGADYHAVLDDNLHTPRYDPSLWQVAWDGADVARFVIVTVDQHCVVRFAELAFGKRWRRRHVGPP